MRKQVLLLLSLCLLLVAVPAAAAPNDPHWGSQWGMHRIEAESAWRAGTGSNILIAVVDTGVHLTHEDLAVAGKLVPGKDYIDSDPPQDRDGHGTHVAGIAAAATNNGLGVGSVAPDAKIMPVRVLNEFGINVTITNPGQIFASTAEAIRWATDNGAQVINLSLGSIDGSVPQSMTNAINYAWSRGVICVVAAGNDSGQPSGYTDQPALVVVATDSQNRRAGYSNIPGGAQWALAAPGSGVFSTYYDRLFPNSNNVYRSLSGTSMAAPHVSGAAAVLRGLGLSPQQTVDRLLSTASNIGPASQFGHGLLNMASAVEGLGGPGGGAVSGTSPAGGGTAPRRQPGSPASPGQGEPAPQEGPAEAAPGEPEGEAAAEEGRPRTLATEEEEKEGNLLLNLGIFGALLVLGAGWYGWTRWRASRSPA